MIKIDFQNLVRGAEILLPLMEEDGSIPSVVSLKNLKHVVKPGVSNHLNYKFGKPIFSANSVISIESFNTYDITDVAEAHIDIFSSYKKIISIDLFVESPYGFSHSFAGTLTNSPRSVIPCYEFLLVNLPLELEDKVDRNFVKCAHQVISTSATFLTFLYTLYHIEDVKVMSNIDGDEKAIDYVTKLIERIKTIGNNFDEAIENLGILTTLL